jgi:fucose permease
MAIHDCGDWGGPSNMNEVLIKQFLNSSEAYRLRACLIQSTFYTGCFLFVTPPRWSSASIVTRPGGHGVITALGRAGLQPCRTDHGEVGL